MGFLSSRMDGQRLREEGPARWKSADSRPLLSRSLCNTASLHFSLHQGPPRQKLLRAARVSFSTLSFPNWVLCGKPGLSPLAPKGTSGVPWAGGACPGRVCHLPSSRTQTSSGPMLSGIWKRGGGWLGAGGLSGVGGVRPHNSLRKQGSQEEIKIQRKKVKLPF